MKTILNLILLIFLITACASPWRVGFDERQRFEESPKIVEHDNRYFLRFRYSDDPKGYHFAMFGASRIKNDTLLFCIPASTSSGYLKGVVQFEEVISPRKIELIEQGIVFWEGEHRLLTPIAIERAQDFDPRRVYKKH